MFRRKHEHEHGDRHISVTYQDKERALRMITLFRENPYELPEFAGLTREEMATTVAALLMIQAIMVESFADFTQQDGDELWQAFARGLALMPDGRPE